MPQRSSARWTVRSCAGTVRGGAAMVDMAANCTSIGCASDARRARSAGVVQRLRARAAERDGCAFAVSGRWRERRVTRDDLPAVIALDPDIRDQHLAAAVFTEHRRGLPIARAHHRGLAVDAHANLRELVRVDDVLRQPGEPLVAWHLAEAGRHQAVLRAEDALRRGDIARVDRFGP